MSNDYIVAAYFIYLPVALLLTWLVANTLFKNGLIFMRDIFFGREEMASATNKLFKCGFYLLNIGFALYILKIYNSLSGMQDTIEVLSSKIGGFSIYLGVMLFLNLYLFSGAKGQLTKSVLPTPKEALFINLVISKKIISDEIISLLNFSTFQS